MSATYELPAPKDAEAFENLCLDLWKEIWNDSNAQKNGRAGQAQAGIDVYGTVERKSAGIQCKKRSGSLRSKLTRKELDEEVAKAKLFHPPLAEFVLATTAPADANIQTRARELTEMHRKAGLFTVTVWSWREITDELFRRQDLLSRLLASYWPDVLAAVTRAIQTYWTEELDERARQDFQQGRYAESLSLVDQRIRREGHSNRAIRHMALNLSRQRDIGARMWFILWIASEEKFVHANVEFARYLRDYDKDYVAAAARYRDALNYKLTTPNYYALSELIKLLELMSDVDSDVFWNAAQYDDVAWACLRITRLLIRIGASWDMEAEAELTEIYGELAHWDGDGWRSIAAISLLAHAHWKLHKLEEVRVDVKEEHLQRAVTLWGRVRAVDELYPDMVTAYCQFLKKNGENDIVKDLLRRTYEKHSTKSHVIDAYGRCLSQNSELHEEADAVFRNGLMLHKRDVVLMDGYARLLHAMSRKDLACSYVCQGLVIEPDNRSLRALKKRFGCICTPSLRRWPR